METVLPIVYAAANMLLLAFVAFVAGRLHELRRQTKKALDKELENMKKTEQVLMFAKIAASKSESATDKSKPAPVTAAEEKSEAEIEQDEKQ